MMGRCCLHMNLLQAPTAPVRASTLCDGTWPATLSEGMAACPATRTTFTSPQGPAMALWCEANQLTSLSLCPSTSSSVCFFFAFTKVLMVFGKKVIFLTLTNVIQNTASNLQVRLFGLDYFGMFITNLYFSPL